MENLGSIISALATFFKLLVAFLSFLGVTDEADKEALDTLFGEVDAVVNNEE